MDRSKSWTNKSQIGIVLSKYLNGIDKKCKFEYKV